MNCVGERVVVADLGAAWQVGRCLLVIGAPRLEQWREKAIAGIDASLKERKGDPVKAELDIAMKRIGELIMQVELLEAKTETSGPLGRRRSRR